MTARFIFDPKEGMYDTAAKRIADTLAMGLPDEEITAPTGLDRGIMEE